MGWWRGKDALLVLALSGVLGAGAAAQEPVWTKPGTPAPAPAADPGATAPAAVPHDNQAAPAPVPVPVPAADQAAAPAVAENAGAQAAAPEDQAKKYPTHYVPVAGKKNKFEYVGPKTVEELAPTPLLDEEGRQRLDPDGKPMFNLPVRQQRDKKGNPVFDEHGKPVMQTPGEMGYDEKGKKIHEKKEKPPKMVSVAVERGTLTVDGMTGKAGLNYDIKNLKYIYIYAPWIGITIVSNSPFPGGTLEKNAFSDKTLTVTVEDHTLQLYSDKRFFKKPENAYVAVDRNFKLPSKFPVIGYGETLKPPYAWPGSRENAALKGPVVPPPIPVSIRPVALLAPCPTGQMRMPGKTPLPGEVAPVQPCVSIDKAVPGLGMAKPATKSADSAAPAEAPSAPAAAPLAKPAESGPASAPTTASSGAPTVQPQP